jgi:hypothetical protein
MKNMGDFLDKCASDAWDIISGRKKIIGNKIVSCECNELKEDTNQDYGWLAPNGKFYPADFGEHQAWASQYLLDQYRNGKIDLKINEEPGDVLCKMGFILLHNPHRYNFSVTRDYNKRITNKQKNFLIEYFENRNMNDWLNKIYQNEI